MISVFDIHPLDWHDLKYLPGEIPVHFTVAIVGTDNNRNEILDWLLENASGRYAFKEIYENKDRFWHSVSKVQVGFEEPTDAAFFLMFFQ